MKVFLIIGFFLILLGSCSTQKSSVQTKNVSKDSLTAEQEFEFKNYFLEANRLFIKGELDQTLDLYNKCLLIAPKSGVVHYKIASVYLAKNEFVTAESYAVKAISYEKNNEWYLYLAGSLYAQNKKYNEAIEVFEKLVKLKKAEIELYIKLADVYLLSNKVNEAIRIYNLAEKRFGINEAISMQKYKLLIAQKKNEDALKELVQLSKFYDYNVVYERLIAEYFIYINDLETAIKKYTNIINENGTDGYSYIGLAECFQLKGDLNKAVENIKIAFYADDVASDDKINLLISFIQNANTNKDAQLVAYELTEILVKKYPENPDLNTIYANFLLQNNLLVDARTYLRKVVEYRKDKYEVWEQLLLIENELNDWKALYEESKLALDFFPNQSFLYFFNGFSGFQLHFYNEAQQSLEFGYKLITKEDPLQKDFLSLLGEVYYKNGNKEKAYECFDKLLTIDATNVMVLNNYAYYLSLDKIQLQKAKEMSFKTIQKEPKNATYLDTYAWVLFTMKNYNEALTFMLQAVEFDINKSEVLLEHLGDIYFHLGDVDKALMYWQKALSMGKENKKLNEKIITKTYTD